MGLGCEGKKVFARMIFSAFAAAFVLASLTFPGADGARASGTVLSNNSEAYSFTKLDRLDGLCGDVYSRTEDRSNPALWAYSYERRIYDAAGVDFQKDTPQVARKRIQTLWLRHQDLFKCDAMNFQVQRGSILKYAVEIRTYPLILNAIRSWQLDLNIIDESDRATVLDFVETKIVESQGTDSYDVLVSNWRLLRRAGAKRCDELQDASRCIQRKNRDEFRKVISIIEQN